MTITPAATSEMDHLAGGGCSRSEGRWIGMAEGTRGPGGAGLDCREEEGLKLSSENKTWFSLQLREETWRRINNLLRLHSRLAIKYRRWKHRP